MNVKRIGIGLVLALVVLLSLGVYAHVDDGEGAGAFEYMEVYMSPLTGAEEARSLGLNSVDEDWGLWGHNLRRVLPHRPAESVFAWHDGERDEEQFCFSSDTLLGYIADYIEENFGRQPQQRFAILPNDNGTVCLCRKCRDRGNRAGDASPAAFYMLERLALRFPEHVFFTSDYLTTRKLPRQRLPGNTGVLVSAMDYGLFACRRREAGEERFRNTLRQWGAVTGNVYVWDYICNFDDYLTPFPVFTAMQRRLRLYADAGVKGVFLNGSGTDYSSLQAVKGRVLAAMLKSPDAEWADFLGETCRARYPNVGGMIADFLLEQEEWTARHGHKLPLYGGVRDALGSFLPDEKFIRFHDALGTKLPELSGHERTEVASLWHGLAFTRLELMRLQGRTEGAEEMLRRLELLENEGVMAYNEAGWSIRDYVEDYRYMLNHAAETGATNVLRGERLLALSALDEDYTDTGLLTDGLLGLPSNYHCGHLISSVSGELRLQLPKRAGGLRRLRVYVSSNPRFRIQWPEYVGLSVGGRELARGVPVDVGRGHAVVNFELPAGVEGDVVLTCVRKSGARQMALEEVEGFENQ